MGRYRNRRRPRLTFRMQLILLCLSLLPICVLVPMLWKWGIKNVEYLYQAHDNSTLPTSSLPSASPSGLRSLSVISLSQSHPQKPNSIFNPTFMKANKIDRISTALESISVETGVPVVELIDHLTGHAWNEEDAWEIKQYVEG